MKGLGRERARLSLQILDVGWPELHAPPLDQVCTICKAQESWLNSDPQHVVVIHCRVSAAPCPGLGGAGVPRGPPFTPMSRSAGICGHVTYLSLKRKRVLPFPEFGSRICRPWATERIAGRFETNERH